MKKIVNFTLNILTFGWYNKWNANRRLSITLKHFQPEICSDISRPGLFSSLLKKEQKGPLRIKLNHRGLS